MDEEVETELGSLVRQFVEQSQVPLSLEDAQSMLLSLSLHPLKGKKLKKKVRRAHKSVTFPTLTRVCT